MFLFFLSLQPRGFGQLQQHNLCFLAFFSGKKASQPAVSGQSRRCTSFFTHISAHSLHAAAFPFFSAKGAIKDPSPAVLDAVIAAQPGQRNVLLSCMLSFGCTPSSSV